MGWFDGVQDGLAVVNDIVGQSVGIFDQIAARANGFNPPRPYGPSEQKPPEPEPEPKPADQIIVPAGSGQQQGGVLLILGVVVVVLLLTR